MFKPIYKRLVTPTVGMKFHVGRGSQSSQGAKESPWTHIRPLSPGLGVFPLYNTAALARVPVGDDGDDSSHSGHRMLQKQALVCFPNRHDSALYLNFLKNSCLLLIGQCGQVLLEF